MPGPAASLRLGRDQRSWLRWDLLAGITTAAVVPQVVALAGVAVTVLLQTGRDLAIVAAGLLYDAAYLRPRRDTHWILLDPLIAQRDADDG